MKRNILPIVVLFAVALSACPKATADLELDAARQAMDEARSKRANDCAKETYQAAESALSEAARLADEGDVEAAKQKAAEAKTLAEQAAAASKPGCADEEVAEDEPDPDREQSGMAASRDALPSLDEVLDTVYFDFNESTIRDESKEMLSRAAQVLAETPSQKIEVEGHCDVRGSTEYNLHLGERRARSVMKYLVRQGVEPKQIDIISYGEERPEDLGGSEEAHQKNRRAELKKR